VEEGKIFVIVDGEHKFVGNVGDESLSISVPAGNFTYTLEPSVTADDDGGAPPGTGGSGGPH
jgi:hypothetical protein